MDDVARNVRSRFGREGRGAEIMDAAELLIHPNALHFVWKPDGKLQSVQLD